MSDERLTDNERRSAAGDARRSDASTDRRARTRGGRRDEDVKKPWYVRRRLWLAAASIMYVGWRRILGGKSRA